MTNFFEQQAAARRRTAWLLFLYVLSVLLTIALSVAATLVILWVFMRPSGQQFGDTSSLTSGEMAGAAGAVAAFQGLVVLGASMYKSAQLSSGGKAVALLMGGQELLAQTRDPAERRLLNVVEEMALASGVPVPAVYVLDEPGINAFAAGHAPGDAVIAVSRGCLEYLTRDELQGVVAHEFSHILNGDMSINLRLIGWVFGLIALSLVGQMMIRSMAWNRGGRDDRGGRDGNNFAVALLLIGLVLWILGLIGAFFGDLLKASVSRQREYLADASAVQFTRNPDGIAGALKKIGGLQAGSTIDNPHAPEVSHLFFASALSNLQLFATHPPLEDRIRRLDPRWDGTYPEVKPINVVEDEPAKKPAKPTIGGRFPIPIPRPSAPAMLLSAVNCTGIPTPERADQAHDLIDQVPAVLREAGSEPFSARALVYCLTFDMNPDVRARQLERLKKLAPPRDLEAVTRLLPVVDSVPEIHWLSLLDLAIPALRRMSPGQYKDFHIALDAIVQADARLRPFEYLIYCVLERYLDPGFGHEPRRMPPPPPSAVPRLVSEVISLLAWQGNDTPESVQAAYAAGMHLFLGTASIPPLVPRDACTIEGLDSRMRRLAALPPRDRKRILLACGACIASDGKVTVVEAELYRAIGDALGCPIPPLDVPPA
jgi:Zn-dependent protease with chaperone function